MQKTKTAPLLALGFKLFAMSAIAANSFAEVTDDNWYQVEVIVFSQSMGAQDTQETWPVDIALAYPPGTVPLHDPNAIVVDETEPTDQFLTVAPPDLDRSEGASEELFTPGALDQGNQNPVPGTQEVQDQASAAGADYSTGSGDTQTLEQVEAPEPEPPFVLLPTSELELTAAANRLARAGRTRVLTHVGWRQALPDRNQAKEVVITGGDQFADHFELEGTISVSLSRFIHLKTNLWLTQFYPNYGQLSGFSKWPPLPKLPSFGQPQRDREDSLTFSSWQTEDQSAVNLKPLDSNLGGTGFSGPEYLVQQIILNQQSRKMRSSEIHYLDHPVIGVVAVVTQVERGVINEDTSQEVSTVITGDQ